MAMQTNNQDYPLEWKVIDSLEQEGLIRSALDRVEALYVRAKREEAYSQVIKTLIYQSKYQMQLEENGEVLVIERLQKEMTSASFPLQPILQSMLAEMYASYLGAHYWELGDRTTTADFRPEDLGTWSAAQLQQECNQLYLRSVSYTQSRAIPLEDWAAITMPGVNTTGRWPSLYDFLTQRAIAHFASGQQFLSEPAYAFFLDQDEAFAPANIFAGHVFPARDSNSQQWQALRLFQELLQFHASDADPTALLDADLKRLNFVRDIAVNDLKDSLYLQSLERLYEQYPSLSVTGEVVLAIAREYQRRGNEYKSAEGDRYRLDLVRATEWCEKAIARYPGTYGANQCALLLDQLHGGSVSINLTSVVLPGKPILFKVDYRNIPVLQGRVIRFSEADFEKFQEAGSKEARAMLARMKPVQTLAVHLPDDGDLQLHAIESRLNGLPLGRYALVVSDERQALEGKEDLPWSIVFFDVSQLASFNRQSPDQKGREFVVVDRQTGQPLEGVEAIFYSSRYDQQRQRNIQEEIGRARTDQDGFVKAPQESRSFTVKWVKGEDVLYSENNYYNSWRSNDPGRTEIRTHFFLDRAIYRPGQPIYFKGLVLAKDPGATPRILTNENVKVILRDVNYQEVETLEFVTNSFGSFQGTFTAPSGGLLGTHTLVSSAGNSQQYFQVEEYKRPRFSVELKAPQETVRLNESVTVIGEAKAFAGNAIDGATVSYRVVRQARYPWWPWWRKMPSNVGSEMEIGHGETQTDAAGHFEVRFTAIPDRSIPPADKPEFSYTIYADVTDITGETQSSETQVLVSYVGLRSSLTFPTSVDRASGEVKLDLGLENLNGQPQTGTIQVMVQQLNAPAKPYLARYWEKPDRTIMSPADFKRDFPYLAFGKEDEPSSWTTRRTLLDSAVAITGSAQLALATQDWEPGQYQVVTRITDPSGEVLEKKHLFAVLDRSQPKIAPDILLWNAWRTPSVEPGTTAQLDLAVGGEKVWVLLELERDREIIRRRWQQLTNWQVESYTVQEADRGNLTAHLTYVFQNRAFTDQKTLVVPWSNKELTIEYLTFRDKLKPGQQEEWQLRISGPQGERVAAEMVATLYDASLDQFVPHGWGLDLYPQRSYGYLRWGAVNFSTESTQFNRYRPYQQHLYQSQSYPELNWFGFPLGGYSRNIQMRGGVMAYSMAMPEASEKMAFDSAGPPPPPPPTPGEDEEISNQSNPVVTSTATQEGGSSVRTNLKETVFFLPQLRTDAEGRVIIAFTMNEALTRWKLLTLAHTQELQVGLSQKEIVTQKELMVQPNPPRFMRQGDVVEYSAKVSNLTDRELSGSATLELEDALTSAALNEAWRIVAVPQPFSVAPGQSARLVWQVQVPVNTTVSLLTHRVKAQAGSFADGEEAVIPVLTNRMLVTETLPLFVRGGQTRNYTLKSLAKAKESSSLEPHRLTLEFTSNPAWLAVKALPYLMEYPYECTEQIFSRWYANALATAVIQQYPKIQQVFAKWRGTDALQSPLMQNEELKGVILAETPWVIEAQSEAQQRQNIALLFDLDRMSRQQQTTLRTLADRQGEDGGWSWFPGGNANWYITQYMLAGMGHLDRLGALPEDLPEGLVENALGFVDREVLRLYQDMLKAAKAGTIDPKKDQLSNILIHYLYMRSFFPDLDPAPELQEAIAYYEDQARQYWTSKGLYQQGLLALALQRNGDDEAAQRIVRSLRERALQSKELGMYWKQPPSYWWYEMPVETQSLMIEVFDQVAKDADAVEELKIWLLRNKQTTHWQTTKATAEAVYALLSTGAAGESWLAQDKPVAITFPKTPKRNYSVGLEAAQNDAEAGTGYFKVDWAGAEIQPSMGNVKLQNPNSTIAWGGLYWQYFEDLDRIETFAETPLTLVKQVLREKRTDRGPVLEAWSDEAPLQPGDKLVVRLELRVDRDMEYVHLKDMRASGLEPIQVLSGYRWQGGLGYYESTGDAATNFFMDYLPKGTYVFEYPLRVNLAGSFSNGITTIQCMYAPEFSSHSAGMRVVVK
ncbi:MAG: alpha-2-macroglobulin [Lewinellaceae bacterium]|nr:alpha-2-macroglobulin [Lewinellaceae bacterium]